MQKLADEDLMTLVERKDPVAFELLYDRHGGAAYSLAHRIVGDAQGAEDVTQEAFLRAFRFLEGFRGDRKFGSWLFSIVRNCAMDGLRRQRRSETPWDERYVPRTVADPTARAELDAALRSVSAEHREAFLLVEVFGLSYQETADVLGVAVGTVKSRMFRARQALCLAIADEEEAT